MGEPRDDNESEAAPEPTLLVLVRHAVIGETGKVLSGRTPGLDLSEEGRAQAKTTAERLSGFPVAAVYASPMERTLQTADAIAEPHDLEVRPLEGVLEGDYGEWRGQRLADLAKHEMWRVVQQTPSRARFPGGESVHAMQARVVQALDDVAARHQGEVAVVVSHFDPIKAAVAHYLGLPLDLYQRIMIGPASVTMFAMADGSAPVLVTLNNTDSLDPFLPPKPEGSKAGASGERPS